jgi:chromosome transmission fidelity protein 8
MLTSIQGKVYLSIGHHKLEGKKAKLAKPLAVIAKRTTEAHHDTMDLDHPESLTYDVVRIIEEKFVFVSRPSLLVQEDLRGLMKV